MKVAIIGAGHVGATFAYALLLSGLAREILLIDKDEERAAGEALDLAHALPFGRPTIIRSGSLADVGGSGIAVITAGSNQRPGETRLDLLERNASIVRSISLELAKRNPEGLIIVATNPVDVLARIASEASGLPFGRVIGSGTILDTARLRHLIGSHFGVDARSVHAHVLGEHGDSSVIVWSGATIGGIPLGQIGHAMHAGFGPQVRERIADEMRNAAYTIVQGKGSTYYAIGSALVRLVGAIIEDQRAALTVSVPGGSRRNAHVNDGVWLGLPAIVSRQGIIQILPVMLDTEEEKALSRSAGVLEAAYRQLG